VAGDENGSFDYHPPAIILAAVVLVPVIFAISTGSYNALPPEDLVATSLSVIQKAVNKAPQFASQLALAANSEAGASSPAQVLFITERQLLTFKAIQGTAAVIPDYEKVFLMEMAMANNKPYLETFYRQIKEQKFALIVSESLKVIYQDRSYAFNEENNAWVKRVVVPILCYYEPYDTLKKVRVQLLIPRQKVGIKYLGEGRPANCP